MKLLTFAHRGEAQTFLTQLKAKAVDASQSLWKANDVLILLTKEGVYNTFANLGPILGSYDIQHVYNFGIAGCLDKNLELDTIQPIRTVYGHQSTPEFRSFSTGTADAKLDCMTSWQRVLDDSYAKELSSFANIVDRELWAIGLLCHQQNINFSAYKYLSDYAGADTACFDLKARAQEFSDRLFEYYQGLELDMSQIQSNTKELTLPFHTSFTQSKSIQKLQKKISQELFETKLSQSLNANEFIQKLNYTLYPLDKKIDTKIASLQLPFKEIGASLHFDPKRENKTVKLTMDINSQTNIDKLSQTLADFDYEKVNQLWNGELDV